jgi:putative Mn2+ efflux pump MntP
MSPFTIAALAVGMSIDAFVASVSRGAGLKRPPLREALSTGIVFGAVETITPLIGWLAGVVASQYVQSVDHWIAFILLAIVGGRMAMEGFSRDEEAQGGASDNRSLVMLMATAVGTSIDAMAVGVSLAFLQVNIIVVAIAIGLATFAMSTGGMLLSRLIGPRFGKWAEVIGGVGLIGLGASILFEHLTA